MPELGSKLVLCALLAAPWGVSCGRIDFKSVPDDAAVDSQQWATAFGDVLGFPFSQESTRLVRDHSRGRHHANTRNTKRIIEGVYGDALGGGYEGARFDVGDHSDLYLGNEFSLETWLLLGPTSTPFNLLSDSKELHVRLRSTSELVVRITNCDGIEAAVSVALMPVLVTGEWAHVAVTWDGTSVRVFKDAQEVGQAAFDALPCEVFDAMHTIDLPFEGGIDEFKLWRKARSRQQVEASMNFDTSLQATYCGDGVIEGSEECETAEACCNAISCRFSDVGTACGAGSCEQGVCKSPLAAVSDGLLAQYGFEEGSGTTVSDSVTPALDLEILDPGSVEWAAGFLTIENDALIQSAITATKISTAVKSSQQLTLEAWVVPALTLQDGPARIVTIGIDIANVNVLLGQEGPDHVSRFRSTATRIPAGSPDLMVGPVETSLTHLVATTGDSTRRIYVNGVLRAVHAIGGTPKAWDDTWTLSVANEPTRERPWLGELHLIRIYNQALTHAEVGRNFAAGPAAL